MDLDELKATWKQYDNELKKYPVLNEEALRHFHERKAEASVTDTRSAEYFRIGFCSILTLVLVLLLFKVNNNPPIVASFTVVLIANILCMGMSIYKLSYLPFAYFDNASVSSSYQEMQGFQLMIRRERFFSVFFSPFLIASLFILLFLGLTIKTL